MIYVSKRVLIMIPVLILMTGFIIGLYVGSAPVGQLLFAILATHLYVGVMAFTAPWLTNQGRIPKTAWVLALCASIFGIGAVFFGRFFYKNYSELRNLNSA